MTRQLTENQIEFIVTNYFGKEHIPIADKLVRTGKCIVYHHERIWRGGVGNYINVVKSEEGPNLYLYTFDFDVFLSSPHQKLIMENTMSYLIKQKEDLDLRINEIQSIFDV